MLAGLQLDQTPDRPVGGMALGMAIIGAMIPFYDTNGTA